MCFLDFVSLGGGGFFMAVLDNVGNVVCELAKVIPCEK